MESEVFKNQRVTVAAICIQKLLWTKGASPEYTRQFGYRETFLDRQLFMRRRDNPFDLASRANDGAGRNLFV